LKGIVINKKNEWDQPGSAGASQDNFLSLTHALLSRILGADPLALLENVNAMRWDQDVHRQKMRV
jgi:hypothetical protein